MTEARTSEDVELLLAGLGVGGFAELKRLVDLGRREERRLGRRADLVAAVEGIPGPRERLLAALDLGVEEGRADAAGLFVCVATDPDPADPRSASVASGVWASEADAFLALAEEDLRDAEHGQRMDRSILPLFVDNVPEAT